MCLINREMQSLIFQASSMRYFQTGKITRKDCIKIKSITNPSARNQFTVCLNLFQYGKKLLQKTKL